MSVSGFDCSGCSVEINPSAVRAAERKDASRLYFEGSRHKDRYRYKIKSSEGLSMPLAVRNLFRSLIGREKLIYGKGVEAILDKASKKPQIRGDGSTSHSLALNQNVQDYTSYLQMGDRSPLVTGKEKLWRAVRKIRMITEGVREAKAAGLSPKSIELKYLPEFFLGCPIGQKVEDAKKIWEGTDGAIPFEVWLSAHSELQTEGRVRYLNEDQRKKCEVVIEGGAFFLKGKPYTTENETTSHSGRGFAAFVLSLEKKLYVHSHVKDQFHHSSFLSGKPLLAAGEVQTDKDGRVVKVTNKSGHYTPSREQNLMMLEMLRENGIDLTQVVYEEILPSGRIFIYDSAQEYLDKKGLAVPSQIQEDKILKANVWFGANRGGYALSISLRQRLRIEWQNWLDRQRWTENPRDRIHQLDRMNYAILVELQNRGVELNQLQIDVEGELYINGQDYFHYLQSDYDPNYGPNRFAWMNHEVIRRFAR